MGMSKQNVANDDNSDIQMRPDLYASSLSAYTASLQKQVGPGGYITISTRTLLKNLEVNRAQWISSWVDLLNASSPTQVKSTHSLTEDSNGSWMPTEKLRSPKQRGSDRTRRPRTSSSSPALSLAPASALAPASSPHGTNSSTTLPPPPASTLPSTGDALSTNSINSTTTSTSPSPSPPLALTKGVLSGTLKGLILGIGIGGLIVLVGACILVIFHKRKRRLELAIYHPQQPTDPTSGMVLGLSKSTFTYEELKIATDDFSNVNLLGEGGFSYVYKAVLSNEKTVAVKRLKAENEQGEREFQVEADVISRIHHKHLVSLIGYCISGAHKFLIYEFVPNRTLEFHLHGKDQPTMTWSTRLKIALGSARGLAYLHEECNPRIIHRDIKAANILLESNFEAKVADFGLAKFAADTDSHVFTRVIGTFGYMAPDYASSGTLTRKADVFSYGVVLLELITGRRPIDKTRHSDEANMVDWARPLLTQALRDGIFDAIVDPKLNRNYNTVEMTWMIACAAACIRHVARDRPLMTQVVRALEGNLSLSKLNEGIMSGHSSASSPCGRLGYDPSQYQESSKKSRMTVLEGQEQPASNFNCPSAGYGLQPSSTGNGGQQTTHEIELGKMAAHGSTWSSC